MSRLSFGSDYKPPEPPRGTFQLEVKSCKMNDAGDSVAAGLEILDGKNQDGSDVRGQQFTEFVLVDEQKMSTHKDGGAFAKKKVYQMCQALGTDLNDFDTDELEQYVGVKFWAIVKPKADSNGTLRPRIAEFLNKK